MNRGPELLGAPSPGSKNFTQEKNTPLGVGGLHRFPDPVAGPRVPKSHLCSQHFGLPVLALGIQPREERAPSLLSNRGPSEPCYITPLVSFTLKSDVIEDQHSVSADPFADVHSASGLVQAQAPRLLYSVIDGQSQLLKKTQRTVHDHDPVVARIGDKNGIALRHSEAPRVTHLPRRLIKTAYNLSIYRDHNDSSR